jgi:ABC-type branched-subunit amino acid transport system ATPase component
VSVVTEPRPALQVSGVEFSYGRMQVLFDISLDVREGEALALLGTNGAGKSTLLRVISGLEKPTRGSVTYFGTDIAGVPAERLPGKGLLLVVGGRAVFADMSVGENLEMGALAAHHKASHLKERLDVVYSTFPALASRRRQKAGTLSGGEQQQLALAKALLLDPKVLCIDELSLGLAPIVVGELLELVRRIHDAGVSVIVVEQSLNIAAEICERSVFLEKGEVRFEGLTRDLLTRDDIARAVFLGSNDSAAQVPGTVTNGSGNAPGDQPIERESL